MVGVMEETATSFKRTYARTVVFSAPDPMAGHCLKNLPANAGDIRDSSSIPL